MQFCIKNKTWFNKDCKRTNLAKQKAYQLWRRNCSDITRNSYVNLRNAAQETYAAVEKEYNDSVRDTLIGTANSHKWWSTLRSALFGVDAAASPLLTAFAFCSGEVKKLLLELDPYGGAGPDCIFSLFFVKTNNYLAPKISTVLNKLARIGGFSMY